VVGGTGLYVEAAIRQYDVPRAPEDPALREKLMSEDKELLEKKLSALSPELYSRTDRSSKKRVVRAVEIALAPPGESDLPVRKSLCEPIMPLVVCIAPDRQVILDRIDCRLDQRLAGGMIEEVETLMKNGVSRERLIMFGMEYKYIALYLCGDITRTEMVEQLRISIHRLSKRQMTWFRGMERRGTAMRWYTSSECADDIIEFCLATDLR
jgi:tRNA dimethylallyltransferase